MAELPIYVWQGRNLVGETLTGEREAPSEVALRWLLAQEGIALIHAGQREALAVRRRIAMRDKALVLRQISTLLKAGVPILQALEVTREGADNPAMRALLMDIAGDLQGGQGLAEAMSAHPRHFDTLACSMVAAGELSGTLDVMLERVVEHQERMLALRSKVRTALFYPAMVLVLALVLTAALLVFVVPTFSHMYAQSRMALPLPTQIVVAASSFVVDYAPLVLLLSPLILVFLVRTYHRSPILRERIELVLLRLPLLGSIVAKAALARWSRTFASLFGAGIPLVQTLEAAAGASDSVRLRRVLGRVCNDVAAGYPLAMALKNTASYPPMVVQMAAVGEESGALDVLLAKVADHYEREVNESVLYLSSLMEPVILLLIGGLVGGIVIAMYMPIFNMGAVL